MRKSGVGSRGGWDRGTGSTLRWWHRWAAEGPLPPTSAAGRRWGGKRILLRKKRGRRSSAAGHTRKLAPRPGGGEPRRPASATPFSLAANRRGGGLEENNHPGFRMDPVRLPAPAPGTFDLQDRAFLIPRTRPLRGAPARRRQLAAPAAHAQRHFPPHPPPRPSAAQARQPPSAPPAAEQWRALRPASSSPPLPRLSLLLKWRRQAPPAPYRLPGLGTAFWRWRLEACSRKGRLTPCRRPRRPFPSIPKACPGSRAALHLKHSSHTAYGLLRNLPTATLPLVGKTSLIRTLFTSSPAAGKSTFVRLLEKHSDEWEIIPEPIAKWCNIQTAEDEYAVGALDAGSWGGGKDGAQKKPQWLAQNPARLESRAPGVTPTITPFGHSEIVEAT